MIQSIYHVNVNCSDFDRSLRFYELLGFQVIWDSGVQRPGHPLQESFQIGFQMPSPNSVRAALLMPEGGGTCRLDLVQWIEPKTHPGQAEPVHAPGPSRIALLVDDLEQTYRQLSARGVEFLSEPLFNDKPLDVARSSSRTGFVCLHDPDGTLIELIEGF